ncbi:MAG: outer membrane beta-barrel family protein [Bacteroidota bacterium]
MNNFPIIQKVYLILLFITISNSLFSQNKTSNIIKGDIVDEKGVKVDIGNVIVCNFSDTSLIKGSVFMDGKFEIELPTENIFFLKVWSIGYNTYLLKANKDTISLPLHIVLETSKINLNQIEVFAAKPSFKNDGDMLTVFVEGSIIGNSGTASDVLKKSPGIAVKGDGSVSVFGKGTPKIYLNDELITPDMLKTVPASEISKVEIIKSPGAKYDAEGGAVINIITKSYGLNGFQGEISNETCKSIYGGNRTTARLSIKNNKWSFIFRYSFMIYSSKSTDEYNRDFIDKTDTINMINTIERNQHGIGVHSGGSSIKYNIDSLNSIGFNYSAYYSDWRIKTENSNLIKLNRVGTTINTNTTGKNITNYNSLNLNYKKLFLKNKAELNTAVQYTNYSIDNIDLINENIIGLNIDELKKQNISGSNINISTAQSNLLVNIDSTSKLQAGIKYSNISNGNRISFNQQNNIGTWVPDLERTNNFYYDENIAAAFIQYNKDFKKVKTEMGLRSEYTKTLGYSILKSNPAVDTNYVNLFPSIKANWNLARDLNFIAGYSYRIDRPNYDDLNPFISYIDSVSCMKGNPKLKPQYKQSFETHLVYMEYASIDFEYARTKDFMATFVGKSTDGKNNFYLQTANYDLVETYTYGIVLPYELKWWTTSNGFGYINSTFNFKYLDKSIKLKRPTYYFYIYDEFRIPKICNIELNFRYFSGGVNGMFEAYSNYQLDISVSKKLLKEKLIINLSAEDILNSYVDSGKSFVPGYEVGFKSHYDTRIFVLGIRYSFGKLKKADVKEEMIGDEEQGRVKTK